MTPKKAGRLLLGGAIVVAVGAAMFLTTSGWWGLVAAAVLSAALAAAGLGVVWTTRTTWGPEPAASARTRDAADEMLRGRRRAITAGTLLLLFGLAGGATIVWATIEDGLTPAAASVGTASTAAVAAGIALIAFGRSRAETDEDAEPEPEPGTGTDPHGAREDAGWRRVTRRDPLAIAIYSGAPLVFTLPLAVQVLRLPGELAGGRLLGFFVSVFVGLAVVVGAGVWATRRYPEVWVEPNRRLLRSGTRETSWNDVSAARLSLANLWPGSPRTLFLTLETASGVRAPIPLRRRGRLILSTAERDLLVRVIDGSSIEVPRAPEDPDGRFSRFTFPEHVERDVAARLVAQPPRADEPLPTAGGG